jgi:hypothetical protein
MGQLRRQLIQQAFPLPGNKDGHYPAIALQDSFHGEFLIGRLPCNRGTIESIQQLLGVSKILLA